MEVTFLNLLGYELRIIVWNMKPLKPIVSIIASWGIFGNNVAHFRPDSSTSGWASRSWKTSPRAPSKARSATARRSRSSSSSSGSRPSATQSEIYFFIIFYKQLVVFSFRLDFKFSTLEFWLRRKFIAYHSPMSGSLNQFKETITIDNYGIWSRLIYRGVA